MRVLALSFACNNACVFCAQGELRRTAEPVDTAAAIESAAASVQPGETLALVGGEPTLDDRLPDFLRALDAAGAGRVLVQTNARRLAYRSYTKALREATPRLALDVSLTGSTEAMHDYHTGTPGSFKQTVLGLRNARAEKIPASVSVVITRSNFRHLIEIVRLCHTLGAVAVRFVPAQPFGAAREQRDRVVPAPELVSPYLALAINEATKLGLPARVDASGAPDETATAAFAGLGTVETERAAPSIEGSSAPAAVPKRSLAIFGRPAPGRREERGPQRRTGDELRTILPTLFDGAAPRDVAEVVAAHGAPAAQAKGGG
ncbi:MAG: radical SAM protein [Polyangiaceae bacterium]